MKREEQLDILKMDLQLMTDIQDEYLRKLLELSEGEIGGKGSSWMTAWRAAWCRCTMRPGSSESVLRT